MQSRTEYESKRNTTVGNREAMSLTSQTCQTLKKFCCAKCTWWVHSAHASRQTQARYGSWELPSSTPTKFSMTGSLSQDLREGKTKVGLKIEKNIPHASGKFGAWNSGLDDLVWGLQPSALGKAAAPAVKVLECDLATEYLKAQNACCSVLFFLPDEPKLWNAWRKACYQKTSNCWWSSMAI